MVVDVDIRSVPVGDDRQEATAPPRPRPAGGPVLMGDILASVNLRPLLLLRWPSGPSERD